MVLAAGRNLMVLDVRELMRRLQAGGADRSIAGELKVARKTVAEYRAWATRAGFSMSPLPSPA
jgi:FixJ family two-component response regulator